MSANLVVDLANTCAFGVSILPSVASAPTSGVFLGNPVDLKAANTQCQLWAVGGANSGVLVLQVQTANASGFLMSGAVPASGSWVDPTSGYSDFSLSILKSGGLWYINSGLWSLPGGGGLSGAAGVATFPAGVNPVFGGQGGANHPRSGSFPVANSGGIVAFASFLRQDQFVRLNILGIGSGFTSLVTAGVLSSLKTTGSGGGFSYSPGSGTVNV